jgi:TonB family protein
MEGGLKAEQHGVAPMPSDLAAEEQGETASLKRAPPSLEDINLQPSMQAMASALAGTGLDHLDGVLDGDATALNTMGWKYASFFNRVKRAVERYWHPDREYRRRDPYGNIYGFKDRSTSLLVVLRGDGSLKNIYVMDPCGAPFLDDEAKEAVELAAPFPNVPDGLKDKRDGLVKFTFQFLVEVGESPVFRIRRYR